MWGTQKDMLQQTSLEFFFSGPAEKRLIKKSITKSFENVPLLTFIVDFFNTVVNFQLIRISRKERKNVRIQFKNAKKTTCSSYDAKRLIFEKCSWFSKSPTFYQKDTAMLSGKKVSMNIPKNVKFWSTAGLEHAISGFQSAVTINRCFVPDTNDSVEDSACQGRSQENEKHTYTELTLFAAKIFSTENKNAQNFHFS